MLSFFRELVQTVSDAAVLFYTLRRCGETVEQLAHAVPVGHENCEIGVIGRDRVAISVITDSGGTRGGWILRSLGKRPSAEDLVSLSCPLDSLEKRYCEAYSQNPKDDSCDGVDCGLEC